MRKHFLCFLALAFFLLTARQTYASHAQGADITYQFVSYDSVSGVSCYTVTVTFYRDCAGISAPLSVDVDLNNMSCTGGTHDTTITLNQVLGLPCPFGGTSTAADGCLCSPICQADIGLTTCGGTGQYPGVEQFVYQGTICLPGRRIGAEWDCNQWYIGMGINARNAAVTNLVGPGSTTLWVEAMINASIDSVTNSPYGRSSPFFTNDPIPFVCDTCQATYNSGAVDTDGDSLVFTLIDPLQSHASGIPFVAGYTVNSPIITNNHFAFDPATGLLNFTPSQTDADVLAILVSAYRHGVLTGTVIRDCEVKILNCHLTPPVMAVPEIGSNGFWSDSNTISVCPGSPLSLTVPVVSPGGVTDSLSSSIVAYPALFPGMTFTQTGSGNYDTANIVWLNPDSGCRYVTVSATTNSCPIAGVTYSSFRVCVVQNLHISASANLTCGAPILLYAPGDSAGALWSPSAGLSTVHGNTTIATPAVSTWYHFTNSCLTDSVYIVVVPSFPLSISNDTAICYDQPVQLSALGLGAGPYTYQWSPPVGLYDTVTGESGANISSPLLRATDPGIYYCTISDTAGCSLTDSVNIHVHGAAPISILPGIDSVMSGTLVNLQALVNGGTFLCTTVPDSVTIPSGQVQIGTATTAFSGSGYDYPAPYGNYYNSARHQMLFSAAELSAILGSSRVISSLSLDIAVPNGLSPLSNLTISMGCTGMDSLTGYAGNLQAVYAPQNYSPVTGWNTHQFDHPYIWDGVSNLVVDICFDNTTNNNFNPKVYYTTTSFRSLYFTAGNGTDMCGVTGSFAGPAPAYSTYFERPNVQFGTAGLNITPAGFSWSPASGFNGVANAYSLGTTATPFTSQWYVASIADSLCPQADSVYIIATPGPWSATINESTVNFPDSVMFWATPVGYGYTWGFYDSATNSVSYLSNHSDTINVPNQGQTGCYFVIVTQPGTGLMDTTACLPVSFPHMLLNGLDTVICLGDTVRLIAFGPGTYSWSDSSGVLSTASVFLYAPALSDIVYLTFTDTSGSIYNDTSVITVLDQHVWPGDANDDYTVNNDDLLYIGIAFGSTGPTRPDSSLIWTQQCAPDWDSTFAIGVNYAHADCNGDGVVNYADTLAVTANFGLIHYKNSNQRSGIYDLTITTDRSSYTIGDTIHATVSGGDAGNPIPNLYGIAYTFAAASPATIHIVSIDQSASWIERVLDFRKISGSNTAYIAQSRINHRDTTGSGTLSEINIAVDASINLLDSVYFTISDILALHSSGDTVSVTNTAIGAVPVTQFPLGIEPANTIQSIEVYPNPNNGLFKVVQSSAAKVKMTIIDALGQTVYERMLSSRTTSIDLEKLPDGIYIASFSSPDGQSGKRIVISK